MYGGSVGFNAAKVGIRGLDVVMATFLVTCRAPGIRQLSSAEGCRIYIERERESLAYLIKCGDPIELRMNFL